MTGNTASGTGYGNPYWSTHKKLSLEKKSVALSGAAPTRLRTTLVQRYHGFMSVCSGYYGPLLLQIWMVQPCLRRTDGVSAPFRQVEKTFNLACIKADTCCSLVAAGQAKDSTLVARRSIGDKKKPAKTAGKTCGLETQADNSVFYAASRQRVFSTILDSGHLVIRP
jgi:hypothetical protein|tara:strand:+ start:33939 stop:34439 length:501 start_codon:yes stop_codon:yes gene_type:complete